MSVFLAGERVAADGDSFSVHEWRGSGPPVATLLAAYRQRRETSGIA